MPEVIQKLPFLHFAITINGAQVYDIREKKAVSTAEIPLETALRVLEYLDGFPVIYDCYQDNWGWMTRSMQENAAAFVPIDHSLRMVRSLRTPVDELKGVSAGAEPERPEAAAVHTGRCAARQAAHRPCRAFSLPERQHVHALQH